MNDKVLMSGSPSGRVASLAEYLDRSDEFSICVVPTAEEVIAAVRARYFNSIVIDDDPPDMPIPHLCRILRRKGVGAPIFVGLPSGSEGDVILALEAGATAVFSSPTRSGELLARLRHRRRPAETGSASVISLAGVVFEPRRRRLTDGRRHITLSESETRLLFCLATAPDNTATREDLARAIWRISTKNAVRRTKCNIYRLRRKIGSVLMIATAQDGYRLVI